MHKELKPMAAILIIAALTVLGGCASSGDVDTMSSDIQNANDTANQAAADAAAAKSDAAAAKAAAEEAASLSRETNEKLDRMFEKSMYK
jgi:murein lipoprotein